MQVLGRVVATAVALVLATGCTGGSDGADEEPEATDQVDAGSADDPRTAADEQEVVEVGRVVHHPSGVQARLERVSWDDRSVVAEVAVSNGSDIDIGLAWARTYLVLDGEEIEVDEAWTEGDFRLDPGEDGTAFLTFAGTVSAGDELRLAFNEGAPDAATAAVTDSPSFDFDEVTLDPDTTRPALPSPLPVAATATHPNGAQLDVDGLVFSTDRIGLQVRAANGHWSQIGLNWFDSHLEDDLGNQYRLVTEDPFDPLPIEEGQALAGVLSFGGRVHPDASELRLVLNDGDDGRVTNDNTDSPRFEAGPWSITDGDTGPDGADDGATGRAGLPEPLTLDDGINHPNGAQVVIEEVRFEEQTVVAKVTVSNGHWSPIFLNWSDTYLADDVDNRYPLLPPDDNPDLQVDDGAGLDGDLVFVGRIDPAATAISVQFNDFHLASAAGEVDLPKYDFGPYELGERATDEASARPPVFVVGAFSTLADEDISGTHVAAVDLILSNLDATEIDGGYLLTIEDALLFDFDRAELRPDARQTLAQLAEVLAYFDGEPARVVGHTDGVGRDDYNLDLSQRRAQAVLDALVDEFGLAASRLTAEGRGSQAPVADESDAAGNDDPAGRQRNRRVEILLDTDEPLPDR